MKSNHSTIESDSDKDNSDHLLSRMKGKTNSSNELLSTCPSKNMVVNAGVSLKDKDRHIKVAYSTSRDSDNLFS